MKKYLLLLLPALLLLAGCKSEEPQVALQSISLNKSKLEIENGSTARLIVIYSPEEAEDNAPPVIWESAKTRIATVDDNGKITAKNVGTTTITASCGKFSAECEVTVVKAVVPTLSVSPTSINSPETGGEWSLDITTSTEWTASASADWITLSETKAIGNKKLTVTVAANETFEDNEGEITVKAASSTVKVAVKRAGRTPASLALNPSLIEIPAAGGTAKTKVLCSIAWSVTAVDWATVNPAEGEGDTEVEITVSENNSVETIEQKLEFNNGQKKEQLTVRRLGRAPKPITLNPASIEAPPAGNTYTVTVTSELDWTVQNSSSWVSTQNKTANKIDIVVAPFSSARGSDTEAHLTFSNGEAQTILTVTQEAPYLTIDKQNLEISDDGGYETVNITSNVSWTASSDVTWIKISATTGTGSKSMAITIDAADTQSTTTGKVTFTGGGITKTISITRKGYDPYAFSIAKGKKVRLALGNLQYQASTKKWRFAPNQYSTIGADNENASATYSGWIDLFNWGATGLNGIMPYTKDQYLTTTNQDLQQSGKLTGNNDWGGNVIGSDAAGTWRSLTRDEWKYIIGSGVSTSFRKNSYSLSGVGTVMGVQGLIILPDHWEQPSGTTFKGGAEDFAENVITNWSVWENAGAVFLPFGVYRGSSGSTYKILDTNNTRGYYWTASYLQGLSLLEASSTNFYSNIISSGSGCMVRLARDL